MVLRLAEQLDVPLRDRNQLLLAGGYAPIYSEASLHSPSMLAIRTTLRRLLKAPINALRLTLHPDGLAGRITNLAEVRAAALASLQRQVAGTADPDLQDLYDELREYAAYDRPAQPGRAEVVVPMKLDHQGQELSLLTTIATFGTPLDVTVSELMIESFYPADEPTAEFLRTL